MSPKTAPRHPTLIADDAALSAFVDRLRRHSILAFDTEAASFHRYVDRIYLIQITTPEETVIVDPLSANRLRPIGKVLSDPDVEVVFHDADYDLRVLDRDYGFRARHVFDTRIAAQLLGEKAVGLGHLLDKYFKVAVNKKMQRADWSRRPLTDEMISYAATDTAYLLPLRDRLRKKLAESDRLAWAEEEFRRLEKIRWTSTNGTDQAFLRVKGAKALPPRSLAVLRAVYGWREDRARELDRAPFRVLGNDALLALAKSMPASKPKMKATRGVPPSTVRRYGDELVEVVKEAVSLPQSEYPRVERSPRPRVTRTVQVRLERLKAIRRAAAARLDLEIGVLCPNGSLQAIAQAGPRNQRELRQIPDLKRWQCEALGVQEVLRAMNVEDGQ